MPERFNRVDITGATTAGLIVVFFCLVLLWHDPRVFWNDDYQVSILPVFADIARSWNEGHLPLLSPYSWVCGNLAGEFQYGTFSFFINALVVLIWKFPFTFPQQAAALSIAHLFVLGAGSFLLARARQLSRPLSIFVALVAALNGWIICWGATDWFGALGAFAWLPWAWWGLERALDPQRTKWRFLWPAPFVYLVVTGGFPYTVGMLALLVAWLSIKSLIQSRSFFSIWPVLCGVALGFGLSAPAWLAILDYVRGSAREVQSSAVHWQWIVPPAGLPGLILPAWTVRWADFSTRYLPHTATELACGLVPLPVLVAGLIGPGRSVVRKIRWELLLLLVVLLLSMLPSAGLFRWSFRWLPFFHLILALCAAEILGGSAFDRPANDGKLPVPLPSLVALLLTGVTAIMMLLLHTEGDHAFPFTWLLLLLAGGWVLADVLLRKGALPAWIPAVITFSALLVTYLFLPTNCGVPKYNLGQELTKSAPLDPQRLYLSFFSWSAIAYPSESTPVGSVVRPGSTSMWAGLRFINGYSPIRPAGVAREFESTVHGEIDWIAAKHLLEDEAGPEGELNDLGVDGIIVAPETGLELPQASEWRLVFSNSEGRVFHRIGEPLARVRSVHSIASRPNEQFVVAQISAINDSRNRVEADIEVPGGAKPAMITFSRPYFRGYEATIGSRKFPVTSDRGLFPVVEVPGGSNGRLILNYRPWWLVWASAMASACAAILLIGTVAASWSHRNSQTTNKR